MSFDYSQATALIEAYEGTSAQVYDDSLGNPTVGVGFNLNASGAASRIAAVGANYDAVLAGTEDLTSDQINTLLQQDIETAVGEAGSAVSNFDSLAPARQFVVVDMIFNMGLSGFEGFQETIAAIEVQDWEQAGADMTSSLWYSQVGSRAENDTQMMVTGEWVS